MSGSINTPVVGSSGLPGFSGGDGQTVSEVVTGQSFSASSIMPALTGGAGGESYEFTDGSGGGATLELSDSSLGSYVGYGVTLIASATGGMGANEFSETPNATGNMGGGGGPAADILGSITGLLGAPTAITVNAAGGAGGYCGSGVPGGAGGSGADATATLSNSTIEVDGATGSGGNTVAVDVTAVGGAGGQGAIPRADNAGDGGAGGNATASLTGDTLGGTIVPVTMEADTAAAAQGGGPSSYDPSGPSAPSGSVGAPLIDIQNDALRLFSGPPDLSIGGDILGNLVGTEGELSLTLGEMLGAASMPLSAAPGGNLVFSGNTLSGNGNSTLQLAIGAGTFAIDTHAGTISLDGSPANTLSGFDEYQVGGASGIFTGSGQLNLGTGVTTVTVTPTSGSLVLDGSTSSNLVLNLAGFGSELDSMAQLEADTTAAANTIQINTPGGGSIILYQPPGQPTVPVCALNATFSQPSSPPPVITLGSGSSTLALFMSERAEPLGAQFTISVDGNQIGGVQTTTADSTTGTLQEFDVLGNFPLGLDTVSIDYLNASNSLLDVEAASLDGKSIPASALTLSNSGTAGFNFTNTGAFAPVSVGARPDTLALTMSERAAPAGAQFTISVDGTQIGGVQTTSADVLQGQTQEFDAHGSFLPGVDTVSIDYLNASNSLLFVDSSTIDGVPVPGGSAVLSNNGSASVPFPGPIPNAPLSVGSGPDTLALTVAERAQPAGARFSVDVDGTQVDGVQTTTADSTAGQTQTIDLLGDFAPGPHTVSVNHLNAENSLLDVDNATINGNVIAGGSGVLSNIGTFGFDFITPSAPPPSFPDSVDTGSDILALSLSEDFLAANASFLIGFNGTPLADETITAIHGNGQSQILNFEGNFSSTTMVSITPLNEALSGGGAGTLYLTGATVDGATIPNGTLQFASNTTQSFSFSH